MKFRDFLKDHIVYLDGGMGTLLQSRGLLAGEYPERWNIAHSEEIIAIHRSYFEAGSNVVCANTFGANALKFEEAELEKIISAAIENAQKAKSQSDAPQEKFIALDIGPSGKLLAPLGDLSFEDAVELFAKTVRLGVRYGADLIFIETMNDSLETKAALLAAKENSTLPILVSNAYGEDGKLMTGATPAAMVALLEGMGADAIGANCSLGPCQLRGVAEELLACASVPVLLKPNAGIPRVQEGKTVYDVDPQSFALEMRSLIQKGLRLAGGCCGTTPQYIEALFEKTKDLSPLPLSDKERTVVSSYTHAVAFGEQAVLIGERINPTGKKRFKQALIEKDMDYILGEGVRQQEKGAHILDVNVGLPEIAEEKLLPQVLCRLQEVSDLPLQIDTADPVAMERALRCYNGKAMINSVSGKKESMDSIFPLVKKYGGVVVALTLDEEGIPATAEGRVAIAKKILAVAKEYGVEKKDIVFDTLAMTVSADGKAGEVTLSALEKIKKELGCHTSLGVSNISFGLPERAQLNSVFFAMALSKGLSAAIMNPDSEEMMKTYYAYHALAGLDESCASYIQASAGFSHRETAQKEEISLQRAIVKGLKEAAKEQTALLLREKDGMAIVQQEIIPALNQVGAEFEKKTLYLPQLLMSAEAAKESFEVMKAAMGMTAQGIDKPPFVLATVKGDIHDIGKNIVKLLLENYGFEVIDLGKDVSPEEVVKEVIQRRAPLLGLSALMTTTVPAMEETIRRIKEQAPWCKIVVGGAVLTEDYAQRIGADHYAKDAMDGVRYGEQIMKEIK